MIIYQYLKKINKCYIIDKQILLNIYKKRDILLV
jgi:hypothetical protein